MIPSPPEVFPDLLVAMMNDAAAFKKVSFLQLSIPHPVSEAPATVRIVVLPEEPVELTKEQTLAQIARILREGDGFHYSKEGMRVVVMREQGNHTWTPDEPFGMPPIKSN